LADTKGVTGEGQHDRHPAHDGHSAVVPALHKVLMATPLYSILTSRVLAPWVLQGIRLEGEVLEVGAGVGAVAAHLLETTHRLQMVVTDYDPALVAIAERSLGRFSGRVVVACADACDLPFDDERFDFVLSLAMLHHTGDWRRAVREAIRVLRPGGRLVGYDLLEGALLHRRRRPGSMIRRGQLEKTLGKLPVADARMKPGLWSSVVRFVVTKNSRASITPKEHDHAGT
jgi:ubiquinone/menaquinone biosynthesis C-methylase UbiE